METLSPVYLGIIISMGFLSLLVIRQLSLKRFVQNASSLVKPRRAFLLEMGICISAAFLIIAYQFFVLHFPIGTSGSMLIGCIIAGFFIGINSALYQEREVILEALRLGNYGARSIKYSPISRKFTFIAATTFVFVCLILIMVFTRDIEWLINTVQDPEAITSAQLSVTYEILFIMGVLTVLVINLIFSYSRNLTILFNNETLILEKVRRGDLTGKVPIATQDEFGVIAEHTNHMIDGLRHRFELIHSLKLAEEVQQNLLPTKSPYLKGFDVSGTSLYCDQTGGDYYDYFLLPDNKLGITVADACGHGVGAAMLMTTVRAFLISAIENYTTPGHLINHINRLISRDCAPSCSFTTMFFLEIDPRKKSLQWIRAGHEPALLYQKHQDRFKKLDGKGTVLGIDESTIFNTEVLDSLQSGDIILIGTDGIYETRNKASIAFGQENVMRVIRETADQPAASIQDALMSEVESFRDAEEQEDDITLVVITVQ